jgi:hypothetical protein
MDEKFYMGTSEVEKRGKYYRSLAFKSELRNQRLVFHPDAANNGCVWLNGIHTQADGRGKWNNGSRPKCRTRDRDNLHAMLF